MKVAPECPGCGDVWEMAVPDDKTSVRIPCRRCGLHTDHEVVQIVVGASTHILARQVAIDNEVKRQREHAARSIRVLRFGLWSNVVAALCCVAAAYMTKNTVPLSGVLTNVAALGFALSAIRTLRKL